MVRDRLRVVKSRPVPSRPVPGHRTFGNGRGLCISSCASVHRPPCAVTALLWGRRVVRTLADGSGHWCSGRIDADESRRTPRALRSSLLFVRSSFVVPPTLGFGLWVFSLFWSLAGECSGAERRVCPSPVALACSCSCSCSDHLATVLILSEKVQGPGIPLGWAAAAGRRIAHGPRSVLIPWVFVAVLCVGSRESGVESRESRVKSRVTRPSQATLRGPTSYICMMHRI